MIIKKFLILLHIIAMICNLNVFSEKASEQQNDMLVRYGIYDRLVHIDGYVTRGDAVEAILYLAGMTSEMAFQSGQSLRYGVIYKDVVSSDIRSGYLYESSVIANGTENQLFEPEKEITLAEAVTLMVRCLEKTKQIELQEGMNCAIEKGLIENKDYFYTTSGKNLLYSADFAILLERMLLQPKGYIWGRGDFFQDGCFISTYLNLPEIEYSSITTYQDNFEKRMELCKTDKEVFIKDNFEEYFPDLQDLLADVTKVWNEPICLIGGVSEIQWDLNYSMYKEELDINEYFEYQQEITALLRKLSIDYLKDAWLGYIYKKDGIFIVSNNQKMCYGVVYIEENMENKISEEILFLKRLIPLMKQGWYYYETYRW